MRKINNLSVPKRSACFFLWNVLTAFGIIFLLLNAQAAAGELYDGQGRRDPFAPLVTKTTRQAASTLIGVESIDEITIQGVIYDPQHGSMIIANDAVLKEGEEYGAVKVLKIEPNGALFSVNDVEGFKTQHESDQPKKELT